MPRKPRKKTLGNFESPFDEDLEELDTPSDTIDSVIIEDSIEEDVPSISSEYNAVSPQETNENQPSTQESTIDINILQETSSVKVEESVALPSYGLADKFGINKIKPSSGKESIARTFKYDEETISRVESLVYKDQRRSKKIPGTKGFISDFMENAIWQHLYQLGLATEKEVENHLKDYSKYPLNFDNITDEK